MASDVIGSDEDPDDMAIDNGNGGCKNDDCDDCD